MKEIIIPWFIVGFRDLLSDPVLADARAEAQEGALSCPVSASPKTSPSLWPGLGLPLGRGSELPTGGHAVQTLLSWARVLGHVFLPVVLSSPVPLPEGTLLQLWVRLYPRLHLASCSPGRPVRQAALTWSALAALSCPPDYQAT